MRKIILGNRVESPAFFDMTGRPWGDRRFSPFRIGDRAAAYVWLSHFRAREPQRKLIVLEDPQAPGTDHSRCITAEWLFSGLADEIWQAEGSNEALPPAPGQALYHVSMWRIWRWLVHNRKVGRLPLRPPAAATDKVRGILKELRVAERFTTLQPLFDAHYEKHRNAPPAWWSTAAQRMSARMPVLILGDPATAGSMPCPPGAHALWKFGLTSMESLAVISLSALHVGGATGTTLWASIFGVPLLAAYRSWEWHTGKGVDSRPISFGAPVIYMPLDSAPEDVAFRAWSAFTGAWTESTPIS
jgi:hypothetical protein